MAMVRALAFYLPQFHPVRENDEWWGNGFTEWRNVVSAKPLFQGHYQPHIPADLGFYDLRLSEAREAQANLANEYGIHGFCYYHYWFNGRRILERPFDEVLASGQPDFPFCLCWANENWTRAWDGGEKEILLEQRYSEDDDRAHIEALLPVLGDRRYIRVNGRPLLLIYRAELLPDPAATAEIWKAAARAAGLGELYLAYVENFERASERLLTGFDAAVEFAPDGRNMGRFVYRDGVAGWLSRIGILPRAFTKHRVASYQAVSRGMASRPSPPFKRFRCVTPMWDNTARRKAGGRILVGSTPSLYLDWLRVAVSKTCQELSGEERLVFVNAWNEWAEGCHLEPDLKWGRSYLEATKSALQAGQRMAGPRQSDLATADAASGATRKPGRVGAPWLRRLYWRIRRLAIAVVAFTRQLLWRP